MLAKTYGSAVYGVEAITITVEVSVYSGKYSFIVRLPDKVIKESLLYVKILCKQLLERRRRLRRPALYEAAGGMQGTYKDTGAARTKQEELQGV